MNAHNRRKNFLSGFNRKCNLCNSTIFYIKYNGKIITHGSNARKIDEMQSKLFVSMARKKNYETKGLPLANEINPLQTKFALFTLMVTVTLTRNAMFSGSNAL